MNNDMIASQYRDHTTHGVRIFSYDGSVFTKEDQFQLEGAPAHFSTMVQRLSISESGRTVTTSNRYSNDKTTRIFESEQIAETKAPTGSPTSPTSSPTPSPYYHFKFAVPEGGWSYNTALGNLEYVLFYMLDGTEKTVQDLNNDGSLVYMRCIVDGNMQTEFSSSQLAKASTQNGYTESSQDTGVIGGCAYSADSYIIIVITNAAGLNVHGVLTDFRWRNTNYKNDLIQVEGSYSTDNGLTFNNYLIENEGRRVAYQYMETKYFISNTVAPTTASPTTQRPTSVENPYLLPKYLSRRPVVGSFGSRQQRFGRRFDVLCL